MLNAKAISSFALYLLIRAYCNSSMAQTADSTFVSEKEPPKYRLALVSIGLPSLYAVSMTGLYSLWYSGYPQSGFHFINDNKEWLQMDKCGHLTSSYYIGKVGYESFRWAGLSEKKAVWYGGLTGLIYLTSVEVFDGLSAEWGYSKGDQLANTAGAVLFIGQQLVWKQQIVVMKWSDHGSPYAKYNPEQMGTSIPQRMLKDYNGQTYWLSANICSLGLQHTKFPKWINFAVGYGAEGMTGANFNPTQVNSKPIPSFERYRQFYISPDIELGRIPVKSKTLKLVLNALGFLKFPMPALEFNKKGVQFHPLYF